MLGLWSAGREYAVQDLVIFALTSVIGLVIFLIIFWFWGGGGGGSQSKKIKSGEGKQPARWKDPPADEQLGDLGELGKAGSLHEYLLQLHKHGQHPVVSFWWGKEQVVSVCSPQAFKDTVKLTDRANQLQIAFAPLIGLNSIQYAKREDWEDRRKCLYPVFKGETLESYFPHFVTIAQEVEEAWSSLETGEKVPLMKTAFAMTIKGITRCIFDESFEDKLLVEKVSVAYMSAWGEMETRIREGVDPEKGSEREVEFEKNKQYLRDVVTGVINRRKEGLGGEHVPFIDNLLQSGVPEDQAVSDAVAFMIGGFHTSGNFIVWLLWYLATHGEVQDRVREELEKETGGERGDRLRKYAVSVSTTYERYFRQVQDETLRISTLGPWAVRESPDDIIIDGYLVPGGTPIIQALGVGLQNTTSWKEGELAEFNPDRFAPHSDHGRRGLEFCPFGTPSRRKCPGYVFSHFETTVMLSVLLYRYQVVAVPDQKVERDHGLVTMPAKELYILVKER